MTLTAAPTSTTEPESFTLKATSNGQYSPYWINIIDDITGQTLTSCLPGGDCGTTVYPGWSPHNELRVRRFHAEARSDDGLSVSAESAQLTVDVRPYPFEVSLKADPSSVTEPDQFRLTATSNGANAPFWVNIIDEDTGTVLTSCSPGRDCGTMVYPGYDMHHKPGPRHYRAEIRSYDDETVAAQDRLTVDVRPYPFEVTLAAEVAAGADPPRFTLTATSNGANAPFWVNIIDDDTGTVLTSCWPGGDCGTTVYPGVDAPARGFHAEIRSYDGAAVAARSAQIVVIGDSVLAGDDIDLARLAGLFASVDDLCLTLQAVPAPNTDPDSPNDLAKICLVEQAKGKSLREILEQVIKRGGMSGVPAYLLFLATPQDVSDGSPPWTPPPPPPRWNPPYNANPPASMPGAWDAPIAAAAERIRALNPTLTLDASALKDLAKRCVWLAAQALRPLSECGEPGLPMFVAGREYPEATDHIIQALGHHAPWFRLTYKDAARTSWYHAYPETEPGGASSCKGTGTVTACDEFPWQKTEQGGLAAEPLPHLKIIDWTQNSGSGGLYGTFVNACKLAARKLSPDIRYGKGNFLVVPIPASAGSAPSITNMCNGPNPPA